MGSSVQKSFASATQRSRHASACPGLRRDLLRVSILFHSLETKTATNLATTAIISSYLENVLWHIVRKPFGAGQRLNVSSFQTVWGTNLCWLANLLTNNLPLVVFVLFDCGHECLALWMIMVSSCSLSGTSIAHDGRHTSSSANSA